MPSSKVVLKMADGEIGNLRQGLYPCSESVLTLPVWPSMKLTVNRPCCLFPCSELSAQAKQLHVPQSIFPRGTRIKRARWGREKTSPVLQTKLKKETPWGAGREVVSPVFQTKLIKQGSELVFMHAAARPASTTPSDILEASLAELVFLSWSKKWNISRFR